MQLETSAPVAIAVVSWNTRELLAECLHSLEPEVRDGVAEVWVVDNASSDGSADLVRERFSWAKLIAATENLGFGPAVNLVAERTTTSWVAPANADVRVAPGSLARLIAAGESAPSIGIVAPRLVLDNGSDQHSVHSFPTLTFTLLFNLGIAGSSARLADRLALEGHWNSARRRRVDWAVGAFLLVRRTAWDAAGGFDPRQWMYAEDLDLCWRVARAGWTALYEPDAVVYHRTAAAATQAWGDRRDMQWMRSSYAWMLRRRGWALTRAVALVNIAGAAVRATLLTGAAWVAPRRFGHRRRAYVRWTRLHTIGLSSGARLREHR